MKRLILFILLADLAATIWFAQSGLGENAMRCFFQNVERF